MRIWDVKVANTLSKSSSKRYVLRYRTKTDRGSFGKYPRPPFDVFGHEGLRPQMIGGINPKFIYLERRVH